MAWSNNPYGHLPARHGYIWNESELGDLFKRYREGWTVEQLAKKHERTVNAIKCALITCDYPQDLIINNTNYTKLLQSVQNMLRYKIHLTSVLGFKDG